MNKREVIMANTGQTLTDRINAARYALAGQGLARCVCKATTEEIIGPKKKHIDYLIACTNEPNVSIPQLANLLIERANHTSWVVVLKSLITVHQLMSNGNEKFTQYMASSNYTFDLSGFLDRTMARGYNMSQFVRKYSQYINAKSLAYRMLALDLCRIGKDVGSPNLLRVMNMENLSKTLPVLESQLDALLNFECTTKDLNNNVITAAFILSFRDLVKLFVSYNDCIINLLERYFKLSRKKTKEAFDLYKNFLERMDRIREFLSIAEAIGIDKGEIPDLKTAPSSILDALESHLNNLQAKKGGKKVASHSPISDPEENKDLDENKDHEKESSEPTPTNDLKPVGNPFLSKPADDTATSDANIEKKEEKENEKPVCSEENSSTSNNLAVDPDSRHVNTDTDKNDNSGNQTVEHNSNEGHQPPPRPTSSPAKSPKNKVASNDANKESNLISKNETSSKPPSRPPSRPPPPSSASSSRAVSPTVTVDVVADIASRQDRNEDEKNGKETVQQETKAESEVVESVDLNKNNADGCKSQVVENEGPSTNSANQSRRGSAISHSGGHAPPARPAPPAARKQSEAKIEPPSDVS